MFTWLAGFSGSLYAVKVIHDLAAYVDLLVYNLFVFQ
jgi:hypothetical protein